MTQHLVSQKQKNRKHTIGTIKLKQKIKKTQKNKNDNNTILVKKMKNNSLRKTKTKK